MFNYILRRLAIGAATLLLITFMIYGLVRNMPGTPITNQMAEGDPKFQISKEERRRLERLYHLDKHWTVAYVLWVSDLARGNLGFSRELKRPVATAIGEALPATLLLSGTSLILAYLLAVPIGLYATARSGMMDERASSTLLYMLYSIPSFVAGMLLLIVFYVQLRGTIFELKTGMRSEGFDDFSFLGQVGDLAYHMILPTICMTYASLAYYSRFVKANMEEVIRQDYIRTARAKGVSWLNVIVHHAFRNTLIQFVTMLGLSLPALVSGSVILESIFQWPGIGTLLIGAITNRDYPTIMALELIFAVLVLGGQLMADILYAVVDPRVVYS